MSATLRLKMESWDSGQGSLAVVCYFIPNGGDCQDFTAVVCQIKDIRKL